MKGNLEHNLIILGINMKTSINVKENVKMQYTNEENLVTRSNIHKRYSTNKEGLMNFLFRHYKIDEYFRILELGCGTGIQWEGRIEALPNNCVLILSDFSAKMVEIAKGKFEFYPNVFFKEIDINTIPFGDEQFDIVIANHMLYHIQDLDNALNEVYRVLKKDGIFYSSTNGQKGIRSYLDNMFKEISPDIVAYEDVYNFNLQNGKEILEKHFSKVKRVDYPDSLEVTDVNDLIAWMISTVSISKLKDEDINKAKNYLDNIMKEYGKIEIPKETGLFISTK